MEAHRMESGSLLPTYMAPIEMYKVTRGIAGEWGIEGYDVPKKSIVYGKEKHTFAKSLRKTQSEEEFRVKGEMPAPGKYDPQVKFEIKSKTHRPVFKAAKMSYIDAILKSPKLPGPGQYFETPRTEVKTDPKKLRGPVMGLGTGMNYLTTAEFYGSESPGPGAYFKQEKESKIAKSSGEKPNYYFRSHSPSKKPEKSAIGPGTYYHPDYIENIKAPSAKLFSDPLRTSAPRPIMPKSNPVTALEFKAKLTKFVPGVGHYKDYTKPLDGFLSDPKKIRLALNRETGNRFPRDVEKQFAFTKGPGQYNHEDDEDVLKKRV